MTSPDFGGPCPSGASAVVAGVGIAVDGDIDSRQFTLEIFIGETPAGTIVKYCTVNILDDNVDLYLTCNGDEDDGTNGTEFRNKICGI